MKTKHTSLIKYLLAVFLLFSSFISFSTSSYGLSIDEGVSHYEIIQSVKYQVDINYTFTHNRIAPQTYYFKVPRLNDRQPNSSISQYTPPYQESELMYNSINGWDVIEKGKLDKFNNTYDLLNATLSRAETITISQCYNVTLNEIDFENINDIDIGTYTPGDSIHDLYNVTEKFYNCSNPTLISLSNSIVNPADNPAEKASALFNWVTTNIDYQEQNQELGAFEAYNQGVGDCSDYSDLLITLLRIQGIPARKITGFLITNVANHLPKVGSIYSFDLNYQGATQTISSTNEILGHAWVEYYIPDIGWIVCDPTWGNGYFNHIDFLRFNLNIGAWFFMPGATPPNNYISEFPINPSPVASDHSAYSYEYSIEITVLGSNFIPESPFPMMVVIFIAVGTVIPLILILIAVKKGRKK
jgi:hypothetical protein